MKQPDPTKDPCYACHRYCTKQYLVLGYSCIACYLSLVVAGVALSWPSPLTEWFSSKDSQVPLTESQVSWMASIPGIGSAISALPAGIMADRFGRKNMLLSLVFSANLAWLVIMMTRSMWGLIVAQILGGFALGGIPSIAPIYLSEICPSYIRGIILGQLNTVFFFSHLLVYLIGPKLGYDEYILACISLPILFFLTFTFVPQTPFYLLSKGKTEEAQAALFLLHGYSVTSFGELQYALKERDSSDSMESMPLITALRQKRYTRHMIYLQILSAVCQVNGTVALPMYAIQFLGGYWIAMLMGIFFVLASFCGAFMADPFGRKPLLISTNIGCAISTTVCTASYFLKKKILLYLGLIAFCIISSIGIDPLVLTLPSELFPMRLRAFANGLTQFTTSIFCFIGIKIFVPIKNLYGIEYNFVLMTLVSITGAIFSALLPETARASITSA